MRCKAAQKSFLNLYLLESPNETPINKSIDIPCARRDKESAVGKIFKSSIFYFYILWVLITKMELFKVRTTFEC